MATTVTPQLQAWTGQFGDEYTERSHLWSPKRDLDMWRAMLRRVPNRSIGSVLEVGSNIGLNLLALRTLLGPYANLYAVEPNLGAYLELVKNNHITTTQAWNCSVFDMDPALRCDLVFTSGVLIHIAPDDLERATDAIVRASRKYVLCQEYFSHEPMTVSYRDQEDLLFKRDFGAWYLDHYPQLKTIDYGFFWSRGEIPTDDSTWWLFEKGDK